MIDPISSWKLANIIPVPKQSPVQDVNNHLRPISLTPAVSKVAEFVVKLYIAPAILQIIDPCQFGVIPKSSTAHALISMIHNWAQLEPLLESFCLITKRLSI